MRALACRLAWRVLWRWWPDRVLIASVPDDDGGWYIREAGTPSHPHADVLARSLVVVEKLDHGGRRVG